MSGKSIFSVAALLLIFIFAGCASTEQIEKDDNPYLNKNIGEVSDTAEGRVTFIRAEHVEKNCWGLLVYKDDVYYQVNAEGIVGEACKVDPASVAKTAGHKPLRRSIAAEADVKKFLSLQKHRTPYLGNNIRMAFAEKGMPVAAVGYDLTTDQRLMMGGSAAADWFAAQGAMRNAAVAKITFKDGYSALIDSAGTVVFEEKNNR